MKCLSVRNTWFSIVSGAYNLKPSTQSIQSLSLKIWQFSDKRDIRLEYRMVPFLAHISHFSTQDDGTMSAQLLGLILLLIRCAHRWSVFHHWLAHLLNDYFLRISCPCIPFLCLTPIIIDGAVFTKHESYYSVRVRYVIDVICLSITHRIRIMDISYFTEYMHVKDTMGCRNIRYLHVVIICTSCISYITYILCNYTTYWIWVHGAYTRKCNIHKLHELHHSYGPHL